MRDSYKEVLTRFLNSKVDYAVLMTGPWGIGKTWYVKNCLINDCSRLEKIIYVSLLEVNSPEQLVTNITNQILFENNGAKSINLINQVLNFDLIKNSKSTAVNVLSAMKDAISYIAQKRVLEENEHILVFDDLERVNPDLLDDLISVINAKYITNEFHVLFIANEKEIKTSKIFDKYKEKYIRYTVEFSVQLCDIYDSLMKNYTGTKAFDLDRDYIERCFSASYSDKNLRTLICF